jgi:uncharacterized surface protein with fasciclin (FAS1) repeats
MPSKWLDKSVPKCDESHSLLKWFSGKVFGLKVAKRVFKNANPFTAIQWRTSMTSTFKRGAFAAALLLAVGGVSTGAIAKVVTVGGAPMYPTKNIVENAVNSKDHTTLVAAVKAAGLVDTLQGPGPFTVFAPTNAAFDKLPAGTVDTLVKPENKATLTSILTYHVVPGRMTSKDLMAAVKKGGGKATLTTVQGGTLTASMDGGKLWLTDAKGGKSEVTQADVMQSNGVIHVVDTVLMP